MLPQCRAPASMQAAVATTSLLLTTAIAAAAPSESAAYARAPAVFNAVHHAMRQWGSSLHHNGMSFFLAYVPEHVLFHHGNGSPDTPVGRPDWVSFEIEHAESFTDERKSHDGIIPGGFLHTYRTTRAMPFLYIDGMSAAKSNLGTLDSQDYILRDIYNNSQATNSGLHHQQQQQQLTRPQQVSSEAPLTELRRREASSIPHDDFNVLTPGANNSLGELQRAADLCDLCKEWGLQGALRMEAGFEIIKCDFTDGFEQVQALQRPGFRAGAPRLPGLAGGFGSLEYLRSMSERYDGIGAGRVVLDYSSMVSALFFPANLTNPDPERLDLPRLTNTTRDDLHAIKDYLARTVASRKEAPLGMPSINWQGVSDLIVGRYAERIQFMAEEIDSVEYMAEKVRYLLTLFVDFSPWAEQPKKPQGKPYQESPALDFEAAMERCTSFYLPDISSTSSLGRTQPTETDRLLHTAFTRVSGEICKTLFAIYRITGAQPDYVHDNSNNTNPPSAANAYREIKQKGSRDATAARALAESRTLARDLMLFLSWTRFKRCRGCGLGEACVIPMWPLGTIDEYFTPTCKNVTSDTEGQPRGKDYYWTHPGGWPRRHEKDESGDEGDGDGDVDVCDEDDEEGEPEWEGLEEEEVGGGTGGAKGNWRVLSSNDGSANGKEERWF